LFSFIYTLSAERIFPRGRDVLFQKAGASRDGVE